AGADYDRHCPDLHLKTWAVTQRWADVVGYLNFAPLPGTARRTKRLRMAASVRCLSVERTLAHDAKNRPGLPAQILLPGDDAASSYLAWHRAVAGLATSCGSPSRNKARIKPRTCPIADQVPA